MLSRFIPLILIVWTLAGLSPSFAQTRGSSPFNETVDRYEKRLAPKIVGGVLAPDGARPWQVSLAVGWIANPAQAHFCGGSIYNSKWIVTAAHCLNGLDAKNVNVIVGTNKLAPGVMRLNAVRLLIHGQYNDATHDQDIALVELYDPIALGPRAKEIALIQGSGEASVLVPDAKLLVSGWGATQEGGDTVSTLREVEVPFVARETCNDPLSYNGDVTKNMICAGVAAGGRDSCQGDSGGPLVYGAGSANPILAGIVSWGEGCARPGKYGVYARVANYGDWVKQCVASPDSCQ